MSLVRFENIHKAFGVHPVLAGVDFRVETGEKIGLIGRNGTGKSTIFRLITGEITPDQGVIEVMRRARISFLHQMPEFEPEDTLLDVVTRAFAELTAMEEELRSLEHRLADGDDAVFERYSHLQDAFMVGGGYEFRARIHQVLTGLGFAEDEFELKASVLSGGQRTRLRVALVLLEDADLLLLDEPENHLDLDAREWLESYLQERRQAFMVISHDRRLLNAVTTRTLEIENGGIRGFSGNYDAYHAEKELLREQQQKAFDRQQRELEKAQKWIDRFRYKATKAKAVQSKIKQLDKTERVEPPSESTARLKLHTGPVVRSSQVVLQAKELSMAYPGLPLYEGLSFKLERGERVGIIGPNGSGKSTLLRHLCGRLEGGLGEVRLGNKVKLGYYDQLHADLNPASDILTELQRVRPDKTPEQLRTYLGRFLFTGEDAFKPINTLSGGERSRVVLAKLLLEEANLLLLDEPTNHLDIAAREVLEDALGAFPGSLVVVSHDRTLIDKLVDKLLVVEKGRARLHLGNYSHYRWKHAEAARAEAARASSQEAMRIRQEKRKAQADGGSRKAQNDARRWKKRLQELEDGIESAEAYVGELEQQFTELDPADFETAQSMKTEYERRKAELANMYEEWEALAERIAE